MKTLEEQKIESDEMIKRFWECWKALKATGIDGKLAYSEAKLQLGYEPPQSQTQINLFFGMRKTGRIKDIY